MRYDFGDSTDGRDEDLQERGHSYIYPEKIHHDDYFVSSEDETQSRYLDEDTPKAKKEMVAMSKNTRTFLFAAVGILVLLLALLTGCFIYYIKNSDAKNLSFPWQIESQKQAEVENKTENQDKASITLEKLPQEAGYLATEQVYEKAGPSVVGVVVYDSSADLFADPIGRGSGIIISEDGYIVTNSHVVGDSTKYGVKIVLDTGEEISGKIVGTDKKTDLAVIKVEKSGLPKAIFADSDQLKVGNKVLAIGNPGTVEMNFNNTLTEGIISGLNRSLGGTRKLVKYIQTSAAINSGNSGGALLNMYGQVVGINSVKLTSDYEGIGFAIPSNTVKTVIDSLIANGYVSGRVALGISGKMVSAYQAQIYNVPMGVIVAKINSDSDINGKGVKTGDIIIKINDINVTGFDVISEEISKYKVGESVKLTIYRPSSDRSNYNTFDINVKLMEDKGDTEAESSSIKNK